MIIFIVFEICLRKHNWLVFKNLSIIIMQILTKSIFMSHIYIYTLLDNGMLKYYLCIFSLIFDPIKQRFF